MLVLLFLLVFNYVQGSSNIDQFKPSFAIARHLETENYTLRKPQMVVLHYTAGNYSSSANILTKGDVSAHYLVAEDGKIDNIVSEGFRAWHAGRSKWGIFSDINSLSVGIEIVNYGYFDDQRISMFQKIYSPEAYQALLNLETVKVRGDSLRKWLPFSVAQIAAVAEIAGDLKTRWKIPDHLFIGHSDISPGKKVDPGPLFPWQQLHDEYQIGAWDNPAHSLGMVDLPENNIQVVWMQKHLKAYGYDCPITKILDERTIDCIKAFQMHFRPNNIDGVIDDETIGILARLVDIYIYG